MIYFDIFCIEIRENIYFFFQESLLILGNYFSNLNCKSVSQLTDLCFYFNEK